ncbi:hypothetical protein EDD15DRAFT_2118611, partial [Pisolithus albus]
YLEWAAANGFMLMLPKDAKWQHTEAASNLGRQPSLEGHLVEKDQIVQCSESAFHQAAILWLIETDQPIHVLQQPTFQKMVEIASHARNGIKIPNCAQMRQAIIDVFKTSLLNLRK